MRILNIFCCFLVTFFTVRCQADPFGCVFDESLLTAHGLVGNVYYYPYEDLSPSYGSVYHLDDYFTSYASNATIITKDDGHSQSEKATVALNVRMNTFFFSASAASSETWANASYLSFENGSNPLIPVTNFVLSLNGYLIPTITGTYTFIISTAYQEMYITIGNAVAPFGCCDVPDQTKGITTTNSQLGTSGGTYFKTAKVTLVAGFAYPINFFFIVDRSSSVAAGSNYFSYTDPTGKNSANLTGFAFSSFDIEKEAICGFEEEEETVFWTEDTTSVTSYVSSSTVTTTYTNTAGSQVIDYALDIGEKVVNYVPYTYETFTSYIPYDGFEATTTSTQTIIDETETKKIFDVNVPYSTSLSVSTSFYDGTVAANASTVLLTVTPASGTPYISAVVIENIPEGHTSATMYISGNNTVETTYSTDYLTLDGTDGVPTVETVYYVQTPYSVVSTTTTSFYEGVLETTQTIVTTVTPVNGSIYVNDIVVIDKPEAVEKATVFNTGTYTESTTVSTGLVTVYGFDGLPTVFKTYYVDIPTSRNTSTTSSSTSTTSSSTSAASFTASAFVNSTSTASSSASSFGNSTYTSKGPEYSNSTSNTENSFSTANSVTQRSLFTSSSATSTSSSSSLSTPQVDSASILGESHTLASTLVTFAEKAGASTTSSKPSTASATSAATESEESMTIIGQSTLTASDYTTTVVTITSCGSKSCYPKTLTTIVPVSSSIIETSSILSTSSATLSLASSVESNAGVAKRNVGFLNKLACLLAATFIFI